MNYGEVKQRVLDSLGAVSGEIDTQLADFIEDALRDIYAAGRWPWDQKSLTFTVRGDIVGTATWTQGGTSVTLSTGNPASQSLADEYTGGLIKLNGANVYEISAFDQSTGVITTDSEIIDATAGSPTAVVIIQDMITLPNTVNSVIDVIDYLFPRVLRKRQGHHRTRYWPDPFVVVGGTPFEWWVRGVDPSGDVELVLYPPPDEDRTYQLEYWQRPVFPTTDNQEIEAVTGIPEQFHPVLVAGAKYRAFEFEFENDSVKGMAYAEFQRGLDKMRAFGRFNSGVINRLRSSRGYHRDPYGPQDSYWPTDRITGV